MKIGSLAASRPHYYDRNATSTVVQYDATVAPHTATARFSTTIAAGKKLLVEHIAIRYARQSAATVSGTFLANVSIVSGSTTFFLTITNYTNNSTTTNFVENYAPAITIYAGENIYGLTQDVSTGGTIAYLVGMKGTQFDA